MRFLIALLLGVLANAQQPLYNRAVTHQTSFSLNPSDPGQKGDTNFFSNLTPATDGGPWGGGYLLGTTGDGSWDGMASAHILALQMNSYNPSNIAGTSVTSAVGRGVNSMSAWGVPGQNGCMGGNPSLSCSSGLRPFSIGGTIYWPIQAQYDGDYFGANRLAIIRSPDRMKHFCNWANVQAYGGCTPANWSSTGDAIATNSMTYNGQLKTAVQWPWPDYSFGNPMARLYTVPWGPDTAAGPVVPAGVDSRVDTSYTYAFGLATTNRATDPTPVTLHRFSTAGCLLTGCDDPGNWQHKNGSKWDANYLKATGLTLLNADGTIFTPQNVQSISAIYSPDAGRWFMLLSCANCTYADAMFSAVIPDGPWTMMAPSIDGGPSSGGFQGFIDATYSSLGGGSFKVSTTGQTGGAGYVMHFNEWTFTPYEPGRRWRVPPRRRR